MHLSSVLGVAGTAGMVVACTTMVLAPQSVVGVLTSAHAPAAASPAAFRPVHQRLEVSAVSQVTEGPTIAPPTIPSTDPSTDPSTGPSTGSSTTTSAGSSPAGQSPAPQTPGRTTNHGSTGPGTQAGQQAPVVLPPHLLSRVQRQVQSTGGASGTGAPVTFGLSSFNVLGSNHTSPGGDKPFFAPGTLRMEWQVSYLRNVPSDIIGMQEIQRDQLATFLRATGGTYDAWPGTSLGAGGVPQTMVWRNDLFTAVQKNYITIPFQGQHREQPVVLLRDNATGREFWVINAHNAPRDQVAARAQDLATEVSTINTLRQSGLPVLFIGDMNDKTKLFCGVTGRTDLYSPLGGSNNGTCQPPKGMRVDWMFGSPGVQFNGFHDDKSPAVRRITDHAVLLSNVTLP